MPKKIVSTSEEFDVFNLFDAASAIDPKSVNNNIH